ncbi:class I glutamine amidotransferase-like protein [Podospora didyma]|uniref:D-lactate dehydratase n=1 Tax=Podospora didyma TaxID=330526 RepID=A0AAE0NX72_9PEZI|nr:class I glutamine amidotransferase-like protein [Podospora didyma]
MAPKVLIVLTSHDKLGDTGKKTGWYLPEFAHPYDAFTKAGFEITVASPAGGVAPLDPSSVEMFQDDSSVCFLNNNKSLWEKTEKLSTFLGKADNFDVLFYPGGHGPVFDLSFDEQSFQLINEFWSKGKIVSAVCHGPAVFVNVKLPNGEPFVKGKHVTGFSDLEEEQVKLDKVVPFLTEAGLKKEGGIFAKAEEPWGVKIVVDGKLITGQNPASAGPIGEAIVKAVTDA